MAKRIDIDPPKQDIDRLMNQKPPELCNHNDCTKKPEFKICLSFAVHANHKPAISSPLLFVCADHKDIKWDDLVTPQQWKTFRNTFIAMKRLPPERQFSKVVAIPVDQPI